MQKIFTTFLLLYFIEGIFGQTAPSQQDTIAVCFSKVKAATRKAEKLWDKDIYGPVLLVNPFTRQAYANFPDTAGILEQENKRYY